MNESQSFLFLQGVCSPFFPRLGQALRALGHTVRKVNYTVGDRMYWRIGQAVAYQGPMDDLKAFYAEQYNSHATTDIVLFGDCRPVHQPAITSAHEHGIRVHVFEEGYFRPHWITLERDGVNGNSRLPKDPKWYRDQAKSLPHYDNGRPFHAPFWKRAAYDIGYNFWAGLNPIMHRGVRSHIPYSPLEEYVGYVRRAVRVKCYEIPSRRIEAKLIAEAKHTPFYLMPLQLATDAQIVHHSPFEDMITAMQHTLRSFARFAPFHTRLAIKIHPLDPGLIDYRKKLIQYASELGITDRVFYLESGNLPALLSSTCGVVTVNSTVGSSALIHGKPTIALGRALYDLPSLTYQEGLDNFWTKRRRPNTKLFRNFRDTVIAHTQINGGFYDANGIDLAVKNSLPRLLGQYQPYF